MRTKYNLQCEEGKEREAMKGGGGRRRNGRSLRVEPGTVDTAEVVEFKKNVSYPC